ncbi:methionine synthase reductase-like [Acanthaster planci]|uniref:Methionine synthase reductase n=1 Tax=Acanthaster planci TaxID=133434 RepID=A0A8B7XUJ2_ACAPL|nr:methionine synthase reductase-like [Acanthaster planci]XP_022084509.1 methionine synthase reductase-like [Acanthaster planci]XP_022084518.1 methionine synthase reductase-like [Acanthaster planci]
MTKGNQGRFLLVYGSQTGQAKAIAEEIFEMSPNHGLEPEMHCFSMTDKKFSIEKETCIVIVVSTTGDGEPPDTAQKFWRRIKKKTLPSDHLAGVHFTLLGLGDSNYTNFCRNGKNFDQRLEELGASRFYPSGFADDATGLEIVAEPWIEGLYPALRKHLGIDCVSESQTDTSVIATDGTCDSNQGMKVRNEIVDSSDRSSNLMENVQSPTEVKGEEVSSALKSESRTSENAENSSAKERTSNQGFPASSRPSKTPGIAEEMSIKNDANGTASGTIASVINQFSNSPSSKKEPTTSLSGSDDATQQNVVLKRTGGEDTPAKNSDEPIGISGSSSNTESCASLTRSIPPLSESGLTLPVASPAFLEVEFHTEQTLNTDDLPLQGGAPMPSAASSVTMVKFVSATRLTREDAVKTALDLELDISESGIQYQPGDSFSIICPNDSKEVSNLIQRLGLADKADCPLSLQVLSGTKKRRAAIPEYIPTPLCSLRHAFLHCCDIRSPPKKAFLRVLIDHTSDESEKRRLQELCSKQGAGDYGAFIRDPHLSLLDILTAFPSCSPPLSQLFEHLPRLQPRPYSISSSPLVDSNKLHFVFNIVVFSEEQGRNKQREGVCTGWLNHLTKIQHYSDDSLHSQMLQLDIHPEIRIPIFERTNQHFHLPADPTTPIIMIGPGTGVAPFIGFLQHRACMQQTGVCLGPAWLLFGCRHRDRDFLYREVIEGHLSSGILSKLCLSFSRDLIQSVTSEIAGARNVPDVPRYVQDNMRKHATELSQLILEDKAVIYVCGDAKNMAKNVTATWSDIFMQETGRSAYEAACLLATLREEKRYLEDVWT